jgi:AraC-like DNA-binding protein
VADSPARLLFSSPLFELGEFHCDAGLPRWRGLNDIGDRPHVVFPGTNVVIQRLGQEPTLATRNHVMFYNAHDRYYRRLHDERGDHCVFVAVETRLFAELVGASGVGFAAAPSDPVAYLRTSTVVRRLGAGESDSLYLEESILDAVQRSIAVALDHHAVRTARRRQTQEQHVALAEAAKSAIADSPASRTTLGELAERLHVSAFHLARIFRAHTGFTLHGYRNQLRLLLALDRLDAFDGERADLANELGFSSHGHFTDAFRSLFGSPPSAVRAAGCRQLRKIVEARTAAAS